MHPLNHFLARYLEFQEQTVGEHSLGTDLLCGSEQFDDFLAQTHLNHRFIIETLSHILAIPWLDLDDFEPAEIPLSALPEALLRQYAVLPLFQRNQRLYIGITNPFNPLLLGAVRFHTQQAVSIILLEKPKLDTLRQTLLRNPALPLQSLSTPSTQRNKEMLDTGSSLLEDSIDDPPLIRYVNQLLRTAVHKRVSDIHFEPRASQLHIRFRVDGTLYPQPSPPILADRVLSRVKIMAQLDIGEKRLPQDGRFSFTPPERDRVVDCRVSTCPTLGGEKIAVRLLDRQKTTFDLKVLGLSKQQYNLLLSALQKPQGMILVTGPTGSGKTSTLYSSLLYLNKNSFNISSVEDPIEVHLPGINQVNINTKIKLGFAEVLRVFLRQDPDIIMLGEMRDKESAQIATQAAQTGHLVLSTLHTNSAAETLTRLINMGIPTYNVASSVSLIIAQRLLRKLCVHCKEPDHLAPSRLLQQDFQVHAEIKAFKAKGCKHCIQGYQGRISIFELLPITATISESILSNRAASVIEKQSKAEGMLTLKASALEKLKEGMIDLVEMNRVMP